MKRYLRVSEEQFETIEDFKIKHSVDGVTPGIEYVLEQFGVTIPEGTTEIEVVAHENYDGPWRFTDH